jgi:hypothetical protein
VSRIAERIHILMNPFVLRFSCDVAVMPISAFLKSMRRPFNLRLEEECVCHEEKEDDLVASGG